MFGEYAAFLSFILILKTLLGDISLSFPLSAYFTLLKHHVIATNAGENVSRRKWPVNRMFNTCTFKKYSMMQ